MYTCDAVLPWRDCWGWPMQSSASWGCSAHWRQVVCPLLEDLGACACASGWQDEAHVEVH